MCLCLEVLVSSEAGDRALMVTSTACGNCSSGTHRNVFAVGVDQYLADVVCAGTKELVSSTVAVELQGIRALTGASDAVNRPRMLPVCPLLFHQPPATIFPEPSNTTDSQPSSPDA